MKLCESCRYRNNTEYEKPCVVYRDDCEYYEKERGDMSGDLISREWLKTAIHNFYYGLKHTPTEEDIQAYIDVAPSVNPQEPKTGHWIRQDNTKEPLYGWYFCSECNSVIGDKTKFCSNCGAKMVEPQETETWNGIHAQLTAPKGTFERIFNDADDDSDI